jgi:MFS family permease
MIASTLGIISIGLSFVFVGGFNIIIVSSPQKVEGISLGMTVLLILVGQSLGPSVAGMFQQMYSQTIPNASGIFPSAQSYVWIFSISGIISLFSVLLIMILKRKIETITD